MSQSRVVVIHRVAVAFIAFAAAVVPSAADAQEAAYPSRTVRVIVPFSAGTPTEVPARIIAQRLIETMGQSFVVDNRAGASGTIGTDLVAKSPPDGYTLLFTNCTHSANSSYYKKLPYDPVADFAPVTQTDLTYGNMLVIHPSISAHTVKELIALAKARPGKLNYASAGIGSAPHVTGALFAEMAGVELSHVPYKGTSGAFNDVLGGRIELMFVSPTYGRPFILAGRVRALGIGGPRRSPTLPDVPTLDEAGLAGFDVTCYHGMWFPAAVPGEIVRRMNAEVVKSLALPEVRKSLTDNGLAPTGNSPAEFADFLKKDVARQAAIAQRIGIQAQ